MSWAGNSGWVTTIVSMPFSTAASTTAKISSRLRWPVASTMPWRATASSTARVSGSSAPSSSTTLTGSMCTPWSRSSCCRRIHTGGLAPGAISWAPRHLVERVDGRQPHRPRALARGDLDRERVHAPDGAVERDGAEDLDPRDDAADDAGALGGRRVVRLQLEARQPELLAAARQADVVDDPLDGVGRDVHVHVVGAAHELAAPRGRREILVSHCHCPPVRVARASLRPPPSRAARCRARPAARARRGPRRCGASRGARCP